MANVKARETNLRDLGRNSMFTVNSRTTSARHTAEFP